MRSSLSAVVAFTFFSHLASTSPAAPPTARPTTAIIDGWESLGCFKESYPGRAIDGESWFDDMMTVESCATFCDSKNLPLLGVEYGRECHCAVDFSARNPAPIGNCWQGCAGNPNESCGNADRLNVYRKIAAAPSSAPAPVPTTVASTTQIPIPSTPAPSAAASTLITSTSPTALPSISISSSLVPLPTTTPVLSSAPLPSSSIPSSVLPLPTTISSEPLAAAPSSSPTTTAPVVSVSSSTTSSFSSTVASATPISSPYYSQGCYSDSLASRTLTEKYSNSDAQTIESCAASCVGFKYFGLEYWFECFCGNDLSSISSPVPNIECNTECNGNSAETCGGDLRMSLYSFGTPSPKGPVALGCYMDSVTARSLPGAVFADDSMTIELCSAHCTDAGTVLFGVEYGRECYCGNTISAIKASASDCDQPCAGDSTETCGAGNRLSVYKISA